MKQSPHKYLKDGHIHTPYCPHGTDDSFEEYVQKAIQVGLDEISLQSTFHYQKDLKTQPQPKIAL